MKLNSIKLKSKAQMILPFVIYLTLVICIIRIKNLISTKLAPSEIRQNFMYYEGCLKSFRPQREDSSIGK